MKAYYQIERTADGVKVTLRELETGLVMSSRKCRVTTRVGNGVECGDLFRARRVLGRYAAEAGAEIVESPPEGRQGGGGKVS